MDKKKVEIVFEALDLKKKFKSQKKERIMKLAQSLATVQIPKINLPRQHKA